MHISETQSLWFLIFAAPIGIFTFYVDMKTKKISNYTVWALFLVFVVVGILTMPFGEYLWRFAHYAVVFAIGILFYILRQVGAGDVKFASVLALFIHQGDIRLMLVISAGALLATVATLLLAKLTPLKNLAPDWAAWVMSAGKGGPDVGLNSQYILPMGTGLSLMLCAYLALGILYGV